VREHTAGAGANIALACDIVIAAKSARRENGAPASAEDEPERAEEFSRKLFVHIVSFVSSSIAMRGGAGQLSRMTAGVISDSAVTGTMRLV